MLLVKAPRGKEAGRRHPVFVASGFSRKVIGEVAMNQGSGGLGAVSAGISEPIVLIILIVVGLLVAFVGWKLVKLILAAIAG